VKEKVKSNMGYSRIKLIALIALFVAGILVGYGVWGLKGEKPPDLKILLQQISTQIERIENESKELRTKMKKLEEKAKKMNGVEESFENVQNSLNLLIAEKKQLMEKIRNYRVVYQGKDKLEGKVADLKNKGLAIPSEIETVLKRLLEENEHLKTLVSSIESVIKKGNYTSTDEPSKRSSSR